MTFDITLKWVKEGSNPAIVILRITLGSEICSYTITLVTFYRSFRYTSKYVTCTRSQILFHLILAAVDVVNLVVNELALINVVTALFKPTAPTPTQAQYNTFTYDHLATVIDTIGLMLQDFGAYALSASSHDYKINLKWGLAKGVL